MSSGARIRLFAALGVGGAALVFAVGYGIARPGPDGVPRFLGWIAVGVAPLFAVSAWLVHRSPEHPQARRLLLLAGALAVNVALEGPAQDAERPGAWLCWVNLVYQYTGVVTVLTVVALLATFPDGVVDRPWQSWVLRAQWALLALPPLLLLASPHLVIHPFLLNPPPVVASPVAVAWLEPLAAPLALLYLSYFGVLAGPVILFVRYRQAPAPQRRRIQPLVLVIILSVPIQALGTVLHGRFGPQDPPWLALLVTAGIGLMFTNVVCIGLGVLRHQWFDVDLVVRRSAVYSLLSLGIAAAYIGLTAVPGLALGSRIPVELAVVLTIIAAVTFQPLRRRLDALADRWAFGPRVNRYQLLTTFGAGLEQTVDLHELLPRLAATVRDGLGASWVRVTLPDAGATAGERTGPPELCVGLRGSGDVVGQIECGPNAHGYEPIDVELLRTLANQAAPAIANVALSAQLAERLHELTSSRARIVTAQDTERRRIERDLHDGAQQHVVALITRLRLARNQLGRGERSAEDVLGELQNDARELLADLRNLAHGIHPPVLSDRGLVAAVEARADRLPLEVDVHATPALREQRLGPAVEVAAYFAVCEALTNIVKHAHTSRAEIALTTPDGHLEILVRDHGTGVHLNGSGQGLTNLRDRVEALDGSLVVEGHPSCGTTVHVRLPLRGPDG